VFKMEEGICSYCKEPLDPMAHLYFLTVWSFLAFKEIALQVVAICIAGS